MFKNPFRRKKGLSFELQLNHKINQICNDNTSIKFRLNALTKAIKELKDEVEKVKR